MAETSQTTYQGHADGTASGPPHQPPSDLQNAGADLGDPAAIAHVRDVVKRSGTSFGPGMRILPKDRRNAMYAVYAFCREIDDIADEQGTRDEKMSALAEWRTEIDRLFSGVPQTPTGRALLRPVAQYHLPRQEFLLLIEGMEMDACGPIQAPSFEDYLAYCRRVAGAVGLLSMPIFGAGRGRHQDRFAIALANALQTTNILRDVAEDCGIDRIYLPKDLLVRHGITQFSPKTLLSEPGLGPACAELGNLARDYFDEAREALSHFDWRHVRPALLMMGIYERYWRRLKAVDFDPNVPVVIPKWEKALLAFRYLVAPPVK